MNIPIECKIEVACADPSRPNLEHVWVERPDPAKPSEGLAVACDGFMLAVVPVTLEAEDVTGYVPVAALKAARKMARRGEDAELALPANRVALRGSITYPRPSTDDLVFPNWRRVVPDLAPDRDGLRSIALQLVLIRRVAQALGTEALKFEFGIGPFAPVVVRTATTPWTVQRPNDLYAVVMPYRASV